jgi:uncharacterized membrane protein YphA (DoxX/SURF4 family)
VYLFETERGTGPGGREPHRLFNPYVLLIFRIVLAAVFIYAALQKIGRPLAFADEIRMYEVLVEGPPLYILAIALPWIELCCGIALLTGFFIRGAALLLAVMNAVFLVVIAVRTGDVMSSDGVPFMEVYFDCGCGFGATYAWKRLIEDSFYLFFSLLLLLAPAYRFVISGRKRGFA